MHDESVLSESRPALICTPPNTPLSGPVLISVHRFKNEPACAPAELNLVTGDWVLIRDQTGEDIGRVLSRVEIDNPGAAVVRKATPDDMQQHGELAARVENALGLFRQLVHQFRLPMKVVDAHLRFDRHEISFYFVSDERLNFRALHKAISSALNMRVVIRQVGVRDYARVTGGIGCCGRGLCCATFMNDLKPVTLRMARQQNLFVEPAKISGICGKLLCCLRFEDSTYREAMEEMPKIGATIRTERGRGRVSAIDIFNRRVTVTFEDDAELVVPISELK